MSKPLLIGVTGGIGSGKSHICEIFKSLGSPVYSADERARTLMNEDISLQRQLISIFGERIFRNGILDRSLLAKQAFYHPDSLEKLNAIVHPVVQHDFEKWCDRQSASFVIKEAALLFETGSYKGLNRTILVSAPIELRIKRVLDRDKHRSEEDVLAIIDRQWTDDKKQKLCDYHLINDEQSPVLEKVLSIQNELVQLTR